MKKIAIDITALSDQYKNRGIGTYTANLVSQLIKNKNFKWHVLGFDDVRNNFPTSRVSFHSLGKIKLSTPSNILFFKTKYLPIIKAIKPDLYFAPHLERGLPIGTCKTSVIIHDISPFLFNKYSSKNFIINYLKGKFYKYNLKQASKADLILTDSKFTKKELIQNKFNQDKIKVTYLGISKIFNAEKVRQTKNSKEVLKKYQISQPYLLYYGGLEPNKNVDILLKAFSILRKTNKDMQLVIIDRTLYRQNGQLYAASNNAGKIQSLIENLNLQNYVTLPKTLADKEMPIALAKAEAFVHLSSYEGFGLAVLEAVSTGCPVIAANASCYPEVFGSAAVLVDLDSTRNIAKSILKVLNDQKLQNKLSAEGSKLIQKYTWEKCAEQTLDAFHEYLT